MIGNNKRSDTKMKNSWSLEEILYCLNEKKENVLTRKSKQVFMKRKYISPSLFENMNENFKINQTLNPKPSFLIGRTKAFWQKVSITENLETATST